MLESDLTDLPERDDGVANIATSKIVTRVFDEVLDAIHQGRLTPGERLSDNTLAATYGVSRTPIREALQRLREIGVVEASASRFTRVAIVSPQKTAEAVVVWSALFGALLDETIPLAGPDVLEAMTKDHADFLAAANERQMEAMATFNFSFYNRLTPLSNNELLRRAITSVVHLVRLGGLNLPEDLDFDDLYKAQTVLLNAVRGRDLPLAHEALAAIRNIRIPR